jgi:hypothetical protein
MSQETMSQETMSKRTGETAVEERALCQAGVEKSALLWDCVERIGFGELAVKTAISRDRLAEFLLLVDPIDPKDLSLWRRYGLAVLPPAVLVAALLASVAIGPRQVVVSAPGGLSALHLVQRQDVEVRRGRSVADAFRSADEVIGRFTLDPLSSGEPLRDSDLSPPPRATLVGRRVLALPVDPAALGPLRRNSRIGLLLAPRGSVPGVSQPGALLPDVSVLAVRRDAPATILVAVHPQDLATLGRYLSSSTVLPVQ